MSLTLVWSSQIEHLQGDHRCSCCKPQCRTQKHCNSSPHPHYRIYTPPPNVSYLQTLDQLFACKIRWSIIFKKHSKYIWNEFLQTIQRAEKKITWLPRGWRFGHWLLTVALLSLQQSINLTLNLHPIFVVWFKHLIQNISNIIWFHEKRIFSPTCLTEY